MTRVAKTIEGAAGFFLKSIVNHPDVLWKSGVVNKNGCYGKNRAIFYIATIFIYHTTFSKDVRVIDNAL